MTELKKLPNGGWNEFVLQGTKVIKFGAEWCGPCKRIAPKFHEMSKDADYEGIGFYTVDVDNVSGLDVLEISSIPLFLTYHDGKRIGELKGSDEGKLVDLVETLKTKLTTE